MLIVCWRQDRGTAGGGQDGPIPGKKVRGHHMSHDSVKHSCMVLSTLNGNVSLGQRSMTLHMELQHAHQKLCLSLYGVLHLCVCEGFRETSM